MEKMTKLWLESLVRTALAEGKSSKKEILLRLSWRLERLNLAVASATSAMHSGALRAPT